MKETIKTFGSPKVSLKIAFLAVLFTLSGVATFTGVLDMMHQAGASTIFKIAVSLILTAVVLIGVYYYSMRWWTKRVMYYLLPLGLAIIVSVVYGWGFYYDNLGLDKTRANQIYTKEYGKMLEVANSNQESIELHIEEMEGLVAHSIEMVDKEATGGNTCNVTWQGYGPRAAFRDKDKTTFESYTNKFRQTKGRFNKVYRELDNKNLEGYTADNVKKLNIYVQKMNAITRDFNRNKRDRLLGWLHKRNEHNNPRYIEYFDDGKRQGYIRCPDEGIKDYYYSLYGLEPLLSYLQ